MNLLFEVNPVVIDVIGYVASGFVLVSFLFKNIKVIRIINVIGAIFFVVYGFLLPTYPTMITNLILIFIHCIYLRRLAKREKLQKTTKSV